MKSIYIIIFLAIFSIGLINYSYAQYNDNIPKTILHLKDGEMDLSNEVKNYKIDYIVVGKMKWYKELGNSTRYEVTPDSFVSIKDNFDITTKYGLINSTDVKYVQREDMIAHQESLLEGKSEMSRLLNISNAQNLHDYETLSKYDYTYLNTDLINQFIETSNTTALFILNHIK